MTWGDPVGTDRAVRRWVPLGVAVALLAALTGTVAGSATASGHRAGHAATGLSFVANRGQLDPRVAFYLPERTGGVYFTSRGATLSLPIVPGAPGYATQLRFVGGRTVAPLGSARLPGTVSSFVGARWQTGIDTFAHIVYPQVWPGVDVVFSGSGARLEYRLVVHPGADPADIRLAYRGASSRGLGSDGALQVATPTGTPEDTRPTTYWRVGGRTARGRSSFR